MWKRRSRTSALDRAQALLSAERSRRRDAQGSGQESAAKTQVSVGESFKTTSAAPKTQNLFSDLSDLSSVSSVSESGSDAVKVPDAGKNSGRKLDSDKDFRPQSSLGGGSRFLKKAPAPTKSSQSPVSRNQLQPESESRYVSSSLHATQTSGLTKLAEIESHIRNQEQEQARQETKPALSLTSNLGISSPPPARVSQTSEASMQLSVQPSSELRGNRFLKKKAAGAVEKTQTSPTAAPKSVDVGVKSRSRAAASSEGLEKNSVRLTSGVNLESDEEDMRKLLGDSIDSTDYSFLRPGRSSAMKKPHKGFTKSSHHVHSTPPAEVLPSPPSNTAPPRSPASASCRSSPFRFTGHAQTRFSPSALSPSPSPPHVSPSPPEGQQRSLSSASGHDEVLSLEEFFPVDIRSEHPHSEMSSVSSEDFKINVMTLDDLAPACPGFTAETPEEPIEREAKKGSPAPASSDRNQQLQEELLDYQSDFESDSRTEPDKYNASQVSEHLQRTGGDEQVVSEVRDEVLDSDVPHKRTEDYYSSAFSATSQASTSQTSDRSHTSKPYNQSRSEDSKPSSSHRSRTSSQQSRKHPSARKVLKEAAVQTQPDPLAPTWPTGYSTTHGVLTVDPAVSMTYMNLSPVVTHIISPEMVDALSAFNPAVFALNELLKQQLTMARRFIESSHHLYSSLLRSLEPPNYRYTTLEDTKKFIHKHT